MTYTPQVPPNSRTPTAEELILDYVEQQKLEINLAYRDGNLRKANDLIVHLAEDFGQEWSELTHICAPSVAEASRLWQKMSRQLAQANQDWTQCNNQEQKSAQFHFGNCNELMARREQADQMIWAAWSIVSLAENADSVLGPLQVQAQGAFIASDKASYAAIQCLRENRNNQKTCESLQATRNLLEAANDRIQAQLTRARTGIGLPLSIWTH